MPRTAKNRQNLPGDNLLTADTMEPAQKIGWGSHVEVCFIFQSFAWFYYSWKPFLIIATLDQIVGSNQNVMAWFNVVTWLQITSIAHKWCRRIITHHTMVQKKHHQQTPVWVILSKGFAVLFISIETLCNRFFPVN